jgi:DNA-binding transcriptional LysR family regulator
MAGGRALDRSRFQSHRKGRADLSFREELHAIDAVIGGQGVAICSDVIVSNELRSGQLVKAHPLALPGYGFYLVSMPHSPRAPVIEAFSRWMRAIQLKPGKDLTRASRRPKRELRSSRAPQAER